MWSGGTQRRALPRHQSVYPALCGIQREADFFSLKEISNPRTVIDKNTNFILNGMLIYHHHNMSSFKLKNSGHGKVDGGT